MKKKIFSSRFEERVDSLLLSSLKELRSRKKPEVAYEQTKIPYVVRKNYVPDWTIVRPDGTTLYLETKGYFDPEARAKMRLIKNQYPDLLIALCFQQNNFIGKKSKVTYTDWAERHGFLHSVGFIPFEWLFGSKTPETLKQKGIAI